MAGTLSQLGLLQGAVGTPPHPGPAPSSWAAELGARPTSQRPRAARACPVRAQRPRPWQRPGGSVRPGAEGLGGDERTLGGRETRLEPEPEPRRRSCRVGAARPSQALAPRSTLAGWTPAGGGTGGQLRQQRHLSRALSLRELPGDALELHLQRAAPSLERESEKRSQRRS